MAVDVSTPLSPGWWMYRLSKQLTDRRRMARLEWLDRYYKGNADLPCGAPAAREAFNMFQRKARSNLAQVIVAAVVNRERLVGFQTAADDGETGDKKAIDLWKRAELAVVSREIHRLTHRFGESYALIGDIDAETGAPVVTAEDPRRIVGEADPLNPRRTRAALKMVYDDVESVSKACLYISGKVWVATLPGARRDLSCPRFNPATWTIDDELSFDTPGGRMPAVRFEVNDGAAEFEYHRDVIDRINDQILQRMTIATMQAFRQRAVRGLPEKYGPEHEKAGQVIDYSGVFTADPAALWQLPLTAEMWESGTVDLTPILAATKDDVGHLSAGTFTPMYMLLPEGANQSAEGSTTAKEGLINKAEDAIVCLTPSWSRVMSTCFAVMGDGDRADLARISPIWASPERLSLAERADAASKATDVPWRTRQTKIWQFTPEEVDRADTERTDDMLLQEKFVRAASAAGARRPAGGPTPPDAGGSSEA